MKIGCCIDWRNRAALTACRDCGLDYVELSLQALAEAEEEEINALAALLEEWNLPCYAVNCIFPPALRVTGDSVDIAAIDAYLKQALRKAAPLSPKVMVFGSGAARQVPENYPFTKAWDQLYRLLFHHIAPAMRRSDMTCAVEALHVGECNILVTCREAMELIGQVDSPRVGLLVDLYHLHMAGEDPDSLSAYQGKIVHAHIASTENSRHFPKEGDGENYRYDLKCLVRAGFGEGALSLEAVPQGPFQQNLMDAVTCLKRATPQATD